MVVAPVASAFELIMILFLAGGGITVPAGVPPLEEDPALLHAAPEGTLAFVEWFGVSEADPGSENATERMAGNEEIQALVSTVKGAIVRAIRQEARGDEGVVVENAFQLVTNIVSRPGCLFVSGLDLSGRAPRIEGGIIVHAGEQATDFGRILRDLERLLLRELSRGEEGPEVEVLELDGATFRALPLPPPVPAVAWGFAGDYCILAVGDGMPAKIADGLKARGGLASNDGFAKLLSAVKVERPCVRSYIDVAGILEKTLPMWPQEARAILGAFGLSDITALISQSGLDGTGFASKSLVATRSRLPGILSLLKGSPLSDADLGVIPADATLATAVRFDAKAAYDEIVRLIGVVDPRARDEFLREVSREFEREVGLRLVEDLLEPLGDTWCLWNAPSQGGLLVSGLTLAVTIRDRDRAQDTMDKLMDLMRGEMGSGRRLGARRPRGVFLESTRFQGARIYYLNAVGEEMPVAPAWCLTDRHLLISLFPQMIKATLARGTTIETSIATVAEVEGRGSVQTLALIDAKETFRTLYPVLHPLAQLGCAELQSEGIEITIDALPTAGAILPYLGREVSTMTVTDAGVLFTSRGTIPNLGPLAGALLPAAAGVFGWRVASVPEAPQEAETAMMMNELRQIHMALQMYEVEHGTYPDSLDVLWSGENKYLQREPRSPTGVPLEYFGADGPGEILVAAGLPARGVRVVLMKDGSIQRMAVASPHEMPITPTVERLPEEATAVAE